MPDILLPSPSSVIKRKFAIAACFGAFLEWYDFLTLAVLAGKPDRGFAHHTFPAYGTIASITHVHYSCFLCVS
jgi:hypothetical protein